MPESGAVAGAADFALKSTTGATADSEFGAVGWAVAGAAGAGAGAAAWCVTVVRVTVAVAFGFGAMVLTERTVWVRVVFVAVDAAGAVSVAVAGLVSVVAGVASVTGGGAVSVAGAGWVDWTSCANNGVDESAKAAAIAGRALVRA